MATLGPDGYHPICSLMTFADVGDVLRLDDSAGAGLIIEGPFASDLSAGADNLVIRARNAAVSAAGAGNATFGLRLTKNLPLASGIGGGSADAAAALRLVAWRLGLDPGGAALFESAVSLGSDVPACLASRPVLATGRGESLQPPPSFPLLHAVLVNPGAPSPTVDAYRAFDTAPSPHGANYPAPRASLRTARETALFLAQCRNDLEAPVIRLRPEIGEALALLRRQPETLLARMSGSGATCFALADDARSAAVLEARIAGMAPRWWVRRVILAGAP